MNTKCLKMTIVFMAISGSAAVAQETQQSYMDLARKSLAAYDGWASFGAVASGRSAADWDHVFVVSGRNQLAAALNGSDPKIVFVSGTIYANVDDAGLALGCADYAAGAGYSLAGYLTAFNPETWGRRLPSGPLEDRRVAASNNQKRRIRFSIPSNTTLIGLPEARIVGASFWVNNAQSVIIRNTIRGRLRLLSAMGSYRRQPGQLELAVRQPVVNRGRKRVGRPLRIQRRRSSG